MVDLGAAAYHLLAMHAIVNQATVLLSDPFIILLLAVFFDIVIGDPARLYQIVPHPVALIGALIGKLEAALNRAAWSNGVRLAAGLLTVVLAVGAAAATGYLIALLCSGSLIGSVVMALVASSFIACRGLYDAVMKVAVDLRASLVQGRDAVSQIVGRDPQNLDGPAVARAAIESLFENFSDGTVAPVLWFAVFGLPGLMAYKAVNTLDSMIGHHSDRYEYFGKIAARLDDIANYLPARISGLLLCLAAFASPDCSGRRAMAVMVMQASSHRSINAGWPESAAAGGLDLALAGPRIYEGEIVDDPWMNAVGLKEVTATEIRRALRLYMVASLLLCVMYRGAAGQPISCRLKRLL